MLLLRLPVQRLKVNLNGEDDQGKYFHKFGCVMGECNECPKWSDHVSDMELNCSDPIRYCVFAAYYKCTVHGQTHIEYNERNAAYCLECVFENGATKSTIRKKYIRMMKSELMKDFIKGRNILYLHQSNVISHILGGDAGFNSVSKEC